MTFFMVPTAPNDYTSLENVLTFSLGVNESCTTIIPIADDSVLESDEVFSVIKGTLRITVMHNKVQLSNIILTIQI